MRVWFSDTILAFHLGTWIWGYRLKFDKECILKEEAAMFAQEGQILINIFRNNNFHNVSKQGTKVWKK